MNFTLCKFKKINQDIEAIPTWNEDCGNESNPITDAGEHLPEEGREERSQPYQGRLRRNENEMKLGILGCLLEQQNILIGS